MRLHLGLRITLAGTLLALLGGHGTAAACQSCDSEMFCVSTLRGGVLCIGDGFWCSMAGKCSGTHYYEGNFAMAQVTLLEDIAAVPAPGRSRVVRGVGELSVGREAARVVRRAVPVPAGDPAIVFSGVGVILGGTAAFRSERGDGFTIRRDGAGRGARVTVCELAGERAGRVLAQERLGEHDALVARVTLDGRPRVLVLQAPTLPEAEARERHERCRRELAASAAQRPVPQRPPFEPARDRGLRAGRAPVQRRRGPLRAAVARSLRSARNNSSVTNSTEASTVMSRADHVRGSHDSSTAIPPKKAHSAHIANSAPRLDRPACSSW